jgi:dihydroneopterin aldolase
MSVDVFQQLALECRRLFLRDHVVLVQIGAHDFEKQAPQRLVFNVELFVPYANSTPQADQLGEVVDYDFIRALIAQRVALGHVELQETLCDELGAQLLAHPQVRAVRMSTSKPDVYPDCAGVGVEIFRMKGVNA